jgi:hypothetical protein
MEKGTEVKTATGMNGWQHAVLMTSTALLLASCGGQPVQVPTSIIAPATAQSLEKTQQPTQTATMAMPTAAALTPTEFLTATPASAVEVTKYPTASPIAEPTENKDMEPTRTNETVNGQITFGNTTFDVVDTGEKSWGPNDNFRDGNNVWIDQFGYLHLTITQRPDGNWSCSEILTQEPAQYGTYKIVLDNKEDSILNLDKNTVLGVFTYGKSGEIDFVEFARWGKDIVPYGNADITIQGKNRVSKKYQIQPGQKELSFVAEWKENYLHVEGPKLTNGENLTFHYEGPKVPKPGDANFMLNLWLHNFKGEELRGLPPINGKEQEVIIKSFKFIPEVKE